MEHSLQKANRCSILFVLYRTRNFFSLFTGASVGSISKTVLVEDISSYLKYNIKMKLNMYSVGHNYLFYFYFLFLFHYF